MVLFCVYFKCLVYFHSFHVVPTSFSLAPNDFKDLYSWWCSRNKTFTHTTDRCIWWICCMSQYSFYFVLFSLSLTRWLTMVTEKQITKCQRVVSFTLQSVHTRKHWWCFQVDEDWMLIQTEKSQQLWDGSPPDFMQTILRGWILLQYRLMWMSLVLQVCMFAKIQHLDVTVHSERVPSDYLKTLINCSDWDHISEGFVKLASNWEFWIWFLHQAPKWRSAVIICTR